MSLINTNEALGVVESVNRKRREFTALAREAAACRACPAMCERAAVLSELNGSTDARVMFIGEAPGRQGGDRTRVPFSGDASGRNLQRYLDTIGLKRASVFFTNAALCNPRTPSGANRTPTVTEVSNCSTFLRRQIEIINPRVVVTLGRVSLAALKSIEYHELTLKDTAGKLFEWNGRLLVPLYHPSPQVLASHRREEAQLKDYSALARALKRARL
ncbi:MAG TPA: uracil-DNA glycosylase [Pyrinomonadaceae bacterium]|jgi:uracil-DNA glycosylase family 4|nr:uracil-DNA glycosylase [Pyrinomonadaceae bacterium]